MLGTSGASRGWRGACWESAGQPGSHQDDPERGRRDSGALGRLGKGDGPGAVCVLFLGGDIAVVVTVFESFL